MPGADGGTLRRLRLTALFALRYEQKGSTAVTALLQRLQSLGIPQEMLDVVAGLLRHCGAATRVGDLYSDRTLATRFATRARANLRVGHVPCSGTLLTWRRCAALRLQLPDYLRHHDLSCKFEGPICSPPLCAANLPAAVGNTSGVEHDWWMWCARRACRTCTRSTRRS